MKYQNIAIIGGSGLEKLNIFEESEYIRVPTVYGKPSSAILHGKLAENDVYVISRHGFEHTVTPTHVNNRAHINIIEQLGCQAIIATTACGSLRDEIAPGHLVFPNQIIDFTRFRSNTFFDEFEPNNMKHTPFADPFSDEIYKELIKIAEKLGLHFHQNKTLITIEGPRFSSRAESHMFRQWGADIINMSTAPEVALANELNIPYAAIAMSTDYDCWKTDIAPVTAEAVLETFQRNAKNVTDVLMGYLMA